MPPERDPRRDSDDEQRRAGGRAHGELALLAGCGGSRQPAHGSGVRRLLDAPSGIDHAGCFGAKSVGTNA